MQLGQNEINEYKKIYLNKFDVVLTDNEANSKGLELLNLVKLIYKPIYKQDEYGTDKRYIKR